MKLVGIHAGHARKGFGATGAVGYCDESVENRKLLRLTKKALKKAGIKFADCTKRAGNQQQILNGILNKAVKAGTTFNMSLHLNQGVKGAHGAELLVPTNITDSDYEKCRVALIAFCRKTGYYNRGIKKRSDLFVLNRLKRCVILEVGFVSDKEDTKRLQNNRKFIADEIAKMIVNMK